jgi:imidazolonepropionase-like amidohydrolase
MYRIADVAVVDPRTGAVTPHQDVTLAGGQIAEVGNTSGPGDLDGRGRFVVPGFADMHAHPLNLADPTAELRLMLEFGITGYRQMSGGRHRHEFDDHLPRLLATAGPVLTPINAGKPTTAIKEVRRQAADGVDFLKAALITPEVYVAVQAEADRLGLPVAGHLPAGIDVRAASRAGFRSIEHVGPGLGVLAGCSCHEEDLRAATAKNPIKIPPIKLPYADRLAERLLRKIVVNPAQLTGPATLRAIRDAIDSFDEEKARELAREFAANGTWNCPTLIRLKAQQLCDDPAFAADEDLRHVSAKERRAWSAAAEAFHRKFDDAQRAVFADQFALQLRIVKILDEEGAPLLAGTDTVGAAWVVPGASLHDEFDLLAQAGLSPLRILQTATIDPARFLGRQKEAGTVEAGRDADLVLLDADPTAAVTNLHTVSDVIRAGSRVRGRFGGATG